MYALLEHTTSAGVHWDLLVEQPGHEGLVTWRLHANPLGLDSVPAERIADHRRIYLDYEGEISGGRGTVRRLDYGKAAIVALSGDTAVLEFHGAHLRGEFSFIRDADGLHFHCARPPERPGL